MVDHHSTHSKILYDVDGKILATDEGQLINIYHPQFLAYLTSKKIRLWRNKTMGNVCYRYFTRHVKQKEQFVHERKYGTIHGPNRFYHVYVDDDVERDSKEYKIYFKKSREL